MFVHRIMGPFSFSLSSLQFSPHPPTHTHAAWSPSLCYSGQKDGCFPQSHLFHTAPCLGLIPGAALNKKRKTNHQGFPLTSFRLFLFTEIRGFYLTFRHHCLAALQPGPTLKAMLQDIKIKTGNLSRYRSLLQVFACLQNLSAIVHFSEFSSNCFFISCPLVTISQTLVTVSQRERR